MAKDHNPIAGVRVITEVTDYPTEYPVKAMELLSESVADEKSHPKADVNHAAWTVLGYLSGPTFQIKRHFLASIPKPDNAKDAAFHLNDCIQAHVVPTWLFPVLAQVLQLVLDQLLKSNPNVIAAPATAPAPAK